MVHRNVQKKFKILLNKSHCPQFLFSNSISILFSLVNFMPFSAHTFETMRAHREKDMGAKICYKLTLTFNFVLHFTIHDIQIAGWMLLAVEGW